jgi:acyl carrier protein
MTMARSGFDIVVEFLHAKRPDLSEIPHDLDLIENRILDSLDFISFLYVVEEQTGQEIPLEETTADDFRTINTIKRRFFQ